MGPFDSIIFDLDGTLWNAVKNVTAAWNRAIANETDIKAALSEDDVKNIMGLNTKEIGLKLFPYLSESRRDILMARCCEVEREELPHTGGSLYPETEETLKSLSEKRPLFIVSNCDSGYIEAFLHYHQLKHCFCATLCYGDTGEEKAVNIKSIVTNFQLKKPVYIGDTEKDRLAAADAGVSFIHAAYGFGHTQEETTSIHKISELLNLL
jgi:phosphoglycolate phosphatase